MVAGSAALRFSSEQTQSGRPATTRHMTDAEAAVLEAARKWLEAKEAVLAADEARQDPVETAHQLDDAEYE